MTDFNPLAGSILGSAQAQQQIDVQKQRQVRRAQVLRRNTAADGDRFEHQVESAEEVPPPGDSPDQHPPQDRKRDRRSRRNQDDEDRPHIDLKA
ncbi:MAG TPA: hypothetical protein VGI81_01020 [Tepidisphaeraceae bacterium]|jgi:hypothetical protein